MKTIGYYKDRTEEFKQIRNPQFYIGDQRIKPIQQFNETNIITDSIQSIKNRMKNITTKLSELHTYQQKYLSIDMEDFTELYNQIERHTNTIKYELKATQNEIIKFGKLKENENSQIVKNVQINLAEELANLTERFKTQNKNYLLKLKQRMMKFDDCFTVENDNDMYTIGFDDNQMTILTEAETNLKDRMSEIKKITQTVQELADMSRELNMLVFEQGMTIDRIDYNIDKVAEDVEEAIVEINKAEAYQKASKVKQIVITLCMCIIGAFLVLMIKIMI